MKNKHYSLLFCLLIIVVFVLQYFIPSFTDYIILNKSAMGLEFYRFITSIFAHSSMEHLLYNLFALALFGFLLERLTNSRIFLIVFFLSGIIANIVSVNFYDSSLGASGAIMGIIGTLTILRPLMMVWAYSISMPLALASIIWIIGDILGVFFPSSVGNIAHISGVIVGLIIGIIIKKKFKQVKRSDKINIPDEIIDEWERRYMIKD